MKLSAYFVACSGPLLVVSMPFAQQDQSYFWPNSVKLTDKPFRRSTTVGMTNQERMKRGLKIGKPNRLWNERSNLKKRFDPQPSAINSGGFVFIFEHCYPEVGAGSYKLISAANQEAALQACAAQTVDKANDYTRFMIDPGLDATEWNCYYDVQGTDPANAEACTADDAARYIAQT